MSKPPQQPKYTLTAVGQKLDELRAIVEPLVPKVNELMDDKRDKAIADKAVAAWIEKNPPQPPTTPSQQQQANSDLNTTLLKYLGTALGIISAMVLLYTQLRGTK